MEITKTSHLLSIFHLFRYCSEVSFREITDLLPASEKTVYRDILLLKQAGVLHIRYSKKEKGVRFNRYIVPCAAVSRKQDTQTVP